MHTFDLRHRTALVTGASSGLGRRFAEILAAAGANVAACARRADRLEDLTKSSKVSEGAIIPIVMNVEDENSVVTGFAAAEAAIGPIDIVIANAGKNAEGPAIDLTADQLDQLLRVNVQGAFFTAREGAKRLIANGAPERGRVILIGSLAAERPVHGAAAYSMSKAAVTMMGKGLAREWARYGITVNTVCPGWVATDMTATWLASEAGQKLIKTFPRRRSMPVDGMDGLVLFLASDASASITGGVFLADEGQVLA